MAKAKSEVPSAIEPASPSKMVRLDADMQKIFTLHTAHQGLDFYERAVGDKVIKEYFALGALRLTIAKNVTMLQSEMEAFEKARVALVRECAPKGKDTVSLGDPKWSRFQSEFEKMSQDKRELRLAKIDRAKLDLAKNPIPLMVLAALEDVLTGDVPGDDAEGDDET
jgi:hypothetical protein